MHFPFWLPVGVCAVMSSRHEISNFDVADVSVMLAVRLMLSSAISALFLSYYRLPTRPEWRERDPGLSLGNGLPNETSPGIVAFPKSKIRASMRDPNFRSATPRRHLALGKTRFFYPQFSIFDGIFKGLKP